MLSRMDGTSKQGQDGRERDGSPAVRGRNGGRAPADGRSRRMPAAVSNGAEPGGPAADDRSPARRSFDALMESRRDESRRVWEAFLGPLLSREQVRRLLRVESDQEVEDLVQGKQLLALPTDEGNTVYPAFQFGQNGKPYPAIARVIELLDSVAITPYTIASWLMSPKPYFGGTSAIRWLEMGRDPRRVVAEARLAAAHMARS
jgi:hypothetical protein